MQPGLAVNVGRDESGATVAVSGEVDLASSPVLLARLEELAAGSESLLLDLRAVSFIDSTGLRALLVAHDRLGERLRIIPGEACQRLFDVAGVREHLPLVEP